MTTVQKDGGTAQVSHGRGGAANINPDDKTYADASIVREGPVGDQGGGAFSGGRGGTGNIGSPHLKPTGKAGDADIVPETAIRPEYDHYHTGRGGEGNIHKDKDKDGSRKGSATATPTLASNNPSSTPVTTSSEKLTPLPANSTQQPVATTRNPTTAAPSTTGPSNDAVSQGQPTPVEDKEKAIRAAGEERDGKKAGKEARRAAWRKKNPPPEHDGLGDRVNYWVKKKIFG